MEKQLSKEWFRKRLGKFSASTFGDLMKKGRAKDEVFSQTAISLMYEKIAEEKTGLRKEISGKALDWGTDNEEYARKAYEEKTGKTIEETGFVELKNFESFCGGSPDGIIKGEKGIIEIKCPFDTANHIITMSEKTIPKKYYDKYYTQMQLNMLVCEAEYCDFISYDPRMKDKNEKIVIIRYEKNIEYQNKIVERLTLAIEKRRQILLSCK